MKRVKIDIASNALIDTAGTGTYGGCSIPDLIANNSSFWMENNYLYTLAVDVRPYVVTGTINGVPFEMEGEFED